MTIGGNDWDILGNCDSGGKLLASQVQSDQHPLTHELQRYMHILGPRPKHCLEALADLGLSDPEIARYFKMPQNFVTDLRQIWKIDGKARN